MKTMMKKFAIDLKIRLGYGTAFFLLLISYLLTLYVNSELLKQAKLVGHTNKVITHLETVLSSMIDVETVTRGYIITKDESFLKPYEQIRILNDSTFNLLKYETLDNFSQQKRLDSLGNMIRQKFELLDFNIDYYPKHNYQISDIVKLKVDTGKEIMDGIRSIVNQMEVVEQALLRHRSDEMTSRYRALNIIVITSLIIAFFLVIYGFFTYTNENRARRKADQTVFEYQHRLTQQIDELNKVNKELIQMRSIEKLAATGRVARTIAHEVRNPLTNINLSVDQLKMDMVRIDDEAASMLDMITRNSQRINQLITDLLNSTKSAELDYQKISINALLDETILLGKDRLHLNNIKVERYYTEDICDISVDVDKLKIAFLNIIVNAIEAMEPEKGILTIRTENKNNKCVVTISDNGSGIDKESLSKLFEPYFTNKPKGTGLGLANTHNIITSHKGYIHVESEIGKGTVFVIVLDFS